MLTIWGRINSHNVKKVVWLAEELGLTYVRHDVGGAFGVDSVYLGKNPNGLVPTIEEGTLTLWESNTILRYLADRHEARALWSADPAERAMSDKWMDWQFTYADAQRDLFLNMVRKAPAERNADAITKSIATCRKLLTILDDSLGNHPWLSGATFGLGDIPMGVYARTWFGVEVADRPVFGNVSRWYAALLERPAFRIVADVPLS